MQAEIITIGDELLIGQVVDTNSAWLGRTLGEDGIKVTQITRSEERRVGKECRYECRSRWSPYH